MNIRFLLPLAVLVCWLVPPIHAQEARPDVRRYNAQANILYRTKGEVTNYMRERCRLDLYYPVGTTGFPTVVWFHGGGLTNGERFVPEGLKEKGIAVMAAGYRLSPRAKSPAYVEDAAAAVAWTFRHIGEYGGATTRIFVSGHSAGGYLACMVGLDKRWLAAHGLDANRIAGLVPFSGQAITHFTIRDERGIGARQPVVDDMAPLYHVREDAPPLLLIPGDRDLELLGRYEENAYLWRMMEEAGYPTTQIQELRGFNHGQMPEPAYPLLMRFIESTGATKPEHRLYPGRRSRLRRRRLLQPSIENPYSEPRPPGGRRHALHRCACPRLRSARPRATAC